jgi:hypothetical protein
MEPASYQNLLETASLLPRSEQRRLLDDLSRLVDRRGEEPEVHSILELQGLGKSVWGDTDAQEYVDRERASWGG